jgi:hypothetical protein
MRTRDLDPNEQQHASQVAARPATRSGAADGDETRRRAQRLLELGDETISQALSQNSERFLSQNRQQGGE